MTRSVHPPENMIYSIGHSNHDLTKFLGLLSQHQIRILVDVRSQPYWRHAKHFDKDVLESALKGARLQYVYLGHQLGGRPREMEFYDPAGHVLYWALAQTGRFLEGLQRLEELAGEGPTAMMCSEENPADCHRRVLIARALGNRGIQVQHIRGDGLLETEADLVRSELANGQGARQLTFLEESVEENEWKSIRSVLPRRAPPSSSGR